MSKLRLNKEKIAQLSNLESRNVQGGALAASTNRNWTCNLCTGGEPPIVIGSSECSTNDPIKHCPATYTR